MGEWDISIAMFRKIFKPRQQGRHSALVALCFFSKCGMPDGRKPCIVIYRSSGMKTSLETVITKSAREFTSTFDGHLEGKAYTNCT